MEFIRYDKLDDKQVAMIGKWEISEILKRVLERGSCDPEDNLVLTSQEQLEKNVDAYYQAFLKVWNNWRLKFTDPINTNKNYPFRLSYALKANYNPNLLKIIINQMLKHDDKPYITTVSGHEVALSAQHLKNYPQAAIIFNGTGKKLSEIETALTCSTAVYLNIDSKFDYDRIKTVYQKLQGASLDHNHNKQPKLCLANKKLLIRYNPNIETLNVLHPYVATAIENSKFGVADQEVEEILRQAQNDGIEISGFHMHLGSTIDQVDIYHQAIASIQKMLNKFEQQGLVKLDNLILNLGGGLGLDYQMFLGNSEHQTQKSCTVEDLVSSTIENDFLALANHHNFEIIFEPGRSLVANVSILVSKILGVKQNFNGTKNFIITDISMNECIRPSLYGSYHHIGLVEADNGAHEQTYDIVGPVCESGDFIGKNRKLPVPEGNSYVILHDVGAYSGCMASNYNLRLRPVEVLVQPDGELQIIAQKESMTSLLSRFKI